MIYLLKDSLSDTFLMKLLIYLAYWMDRIIKLSISLFFNILNR